MSADVSVTSARNRTLLVVGNLLWLAALVAAQGCSQATPPSAGSSPVPEVVQIKLSLSNVFLIRTARPVLIDGGSPKDLAALTGALARNGLRTADIALVILTHAHSDHAGVAAALRGAGAKVALGQGDVEMARAGHNDDLKPTGVPAVLLKHLIIDPHFTSFAPDIVVNDALDLAPWGIGGRAIPMPGHTPGSLVVLLDDGRAFVGDMMAGGYMGGAISPQRAGEHYFHADRARNLENIKTVLKQPVRLFYLGHGGPVDREAVIAGFATGPN